MTIEEIIEKYLKDNGFDGLCRLDPGSVKFDCSCGLDDLMPCSEYFGDCQPAYKHNCDKVETKNGYVDGKCPLDNCGECYRLDKPEAK